MNKINGNLAGLLTFFNFRGWMRATMTSPSPSALGSDRQESREMGENIWNKTRTTDALKIGGEEKEM